MIPKKYTSEMLEGRKARCLVDIGNKGGNWISKGSKVTILGSVRGKGIKIKTETCPCCGQYCYITGVNRNELELVPELYRPEE